MCFYTDLWMYLFLCSCRSLRELRKPYNCEEEFVESVSSTILAVIGLPAGLEVPFGSLPVWIGLGSLRLPAACEGVSIIWFLMWRNLEVEVR